MSGERRRRPDDPARRGWCPSLARPMPTGDGLLARVHPPLGILSAVQLRAVAEAARRFGNGHVDVTARGNLQIRGASEATVPALAACLAEAGLADIRADGGPQRLTLTSPLAGLEGDEWIDVPALARSVEAVGLTVPGLPAKTLVTIDGGGRWGLGAIEADVIVRAIGSGRVAIGLADKTTPFRCTDIAVDDVTAAVGRVLGALVAAGRRRMRDLDPAERGRIAAGLIDLSRASPSPLCGRGWPPHQQGSGEGSAASGEAGASPQPSLIALPSTTIIAIEAPFGRCEVAGLDRLSDVAASAQGGIRTSPSRGFAIAFRNPDVAQAALNQLATAGFITDPADPRRAVAACPGAPACASGTTPVPTHAAELARDFAPFAARGLTAHVSGCAKGCAHPRRADLTLVAEDGRYRAVVGGAPGESGCGERLTFEAALDRVRRADPARSLAGVFRS